jgi:hypothetical protein
MRGVNLSEWALRHRALMAYFMVLLALLGVYGYRNLGQAEDPSFTFKIMLVRTFWPGATAQEVAEQVSDRIEKKLQEVPHIDRVTSFARPGESTVLFVVKDTAPRAEVAELFYQVRKKVGDIRHTLPRDIRGPFFNDEFGDVFGNLYALTGPGLSYAQLKDYAEDLRSQLLRVKDVAKVELFGVQDERIHIDIANARLAALGIDLSSLARPWPSRMPLPRAVFSRPPASASMCAPAAPSIRRRQCATWWCASMAAICASAILPRCLAVTSIRRSRGCASWGSRPSAWVFPWPRAATSSILARTCTAGSPSCSRTCLWASS